MWKPMLALSRLKAREQGDSKLWAGRNRARCLFQDMQFHRSRAEVTHLGAVHGCSLTVPEVGSCNSKGVQRLKHLLSGPGPKRFAKPHCSRRRLHRG